MISATSLLPVLANPYLPETISSAPRAKKVIQPCFTPDCQKLGKRFYHPDHPKDVTKKICEICHNLLIDKNRTWDHCAWCLVTTSRRWRKISQLPEKPMLCNSCYRNDWLSVKKQITKQITKISEDQTAELSSDSEAEQQARLAKARKKQDNDTKKIGKRKSQKRPAAQNPNLQIDPPPAKTRQSSSLLDMPFSQPVEHLWDGSLNDSPSSKDMQADLLVDQFIANDYWDPPPSVDGQASPNEPFAPNFG